MATCPRVHDQLSQAALQQMARISLPGSRTTAVSATERPDSLWGPPSKGAEPLEQGGDSAYRSGSDPGAPAPCQGFTNINSLILAETQQTDTIMNFIFQLKTPKRREVTDLNPSPSPWSLSPQRCARCLPRID